jgi:hypothetical protein
VPAFPFETLLPHNHGVDLTPPFADQPRARLEAGNPAPRDVAVTR